MTERDGVTVELVCGHRVLVATDEVVFDPNQRHYCRGCGLWIAAVLVDGQPIEEDNNA